MTDRTARHSPARLAERAASEFTQCDLVERGGRVWAFFATYTVDDGETVVDRLYCYSDRIHPARQPDGYRMSGVHDDRKRLDEWFSVPTRRR